MTTGISLVRENAASMQPPRSLWVPFALGRPLGKANDPAFQHRVIAAALALLSAQRGPVLQEFPENAPTPADNELVACPVTFIQPEAVGTSWAQRLVTEQDTLQSWHDLGKRRRHGRTLVGIANTKIKDIASRLGEFLDNDSLPVDDLVWFKHAVEDAKTFYLEAMTAQPGEHDQEHLQEVFWCQTDLGEALAQLSEKLTAQLGSDSFARILMPRRALELRNTTHLSN
tara:strand:+ start:136 stop:819 length:684 start_codon:yes stop_codon:yes gene_type:complete